MSHTTPKKWLLIIVSLVLLLVATPLFAACGDDDDDGAVATVTKTAEPTTAEPVTVASPTVTPVPGQPLLGGHAEYDMESIGYTQSEYFVAGTADAYAPTEPLTTDGKWTVEPSSQADYKTRIVVNRPIDEEDFNGTVLVEWLNVSGGGDGGPFWMQTHVELIRRGWVWVGVSAQFYGANALEEGSPTNPEMADPVRYEPINHPGDSYSYDIFSQAGQAIRDSAEVVLGGLEPERLIAAGESQSAGRLTTYINAVHPLALVYDGFCVYSRGSQGSPLSQSTMGANRIFGDVEYPSSWPDPLPPDVTTPDPTFIRGDLDEPVLVFQTENDVGGLLARQDDTSKFRLWEVAGTAHFDTYGLVTSMTDIGERESVLEWFNFMLNPINEPRPGLPCDNPTNNGPATFVLRAGMAHLNRWVTDGTPPPAADRLQTISVVDPVEYALDANGNVLGGIRTPAVDAAVAKLSGFGQDTGGPTASFCGAFGTTIPFTQEQLKELYGDHDGFVSAWDSATQDALEAGFLVEEDAQYLREVGEMSSILK